MLSEPLCDLVPQVITCKSSRETDRRRPFIGVMNREGTGRTSHKKISLVDSAGSVYKLSSHKIWCSEETKGHFGSR